MTEQDSARFPTKSNPNLIPFNLEVGDMVQRSWKDATGQVQTKRYKVTGIYNHIFTVKDIKGIADSFPKCDYMCGVIRKAGAL